MSRSWQAAGTATGLVIAAVALLAVADLGSGLMLGGNTLVPGAQMAAEAVSPPRGEPPPAAVRGPGDVHVAPTPRTALPADPAALASDDVRPGAMIQLQSGFSEQDLRGLIANSECKLCLLEFADGCVVTFVPPGADGLPAHAGDAEAWSAFRAQHPPREWTWIPCEPGPGFAPFLRQPGLQPCLLLDPEQTRHLRRERQRLLSGRSDRHDPEPPTLIELSPKGIRVRLQQPRV